MSDRSIVTQGSEILFTSSSLKEPCQKRGSHGSLYENHAPGLFFFDSPGPRAGRLEKGDLLEDLLGFFLVGRPCPRASPSSKLQAGALVKAYLPVKFSSLIKLTGLDVLARSDVPWAEDLCPDAGKGSQVKAWWQKLFLFPAAAGGCAGPTSIGRVCMSLSSSHPLHQVTLHLLCLSATH